MPNAASNSQRAEPILQSSVETQPFLKIAPDFQSRRPALGIVRTCSRYAYWQFHTPCRACGRPRLRHEIETVKQTLQDILPATQVPPVDSVADAVDTETHIPFLSYESRSDIERETLSRSRHHAIHGKRRDIRWRNHTSARVGVKSEEYVAGFVRNAVEIVVIQRDVNPRLSAGSG